MKYENINILGTMSGTSLDGIDLSVTNTNGIDLQRLGKNKFQKFEKKTIDQLNLFINNYTHLKNNFQFVSSVENIVTNEYIKAIENLKNSFYNFDVIGFHGQTIVHMPDKRFSLQLGDAKKIANHFNKTIVHDFRRNDLLNSGQGAPIAPIYHQYLMSKYNLKLPACIFNIGGISNVTYWDGIKLIGFDVGPGNLLMDKLMQTNFNKRYDNRGVVSSKGCINKNILNLFLEKPFYKKMYPKSLDKENFKYEWKHISEAKINDEDKMSTLLQLTVLTIKNSLNLLPKLPKSFLLTGGGFYNNELKKRLSFELKGNVDLNIWHGKLNKFLEAELISYLAARKIYNLPSSFPTTTGVISPTILGTIYEPTKIL